MAPKSATASKAPASQASKAPAAASKAPAKVCLLSFTIVITCHHSNTRVQY